jgi:hypothetical protein
MTSEVQARLEPSVLPQVFQEPLRPLPPIESRIENGMELVSGFSSPVESDQLTRPKFVSNEIGGHPTIAHPLQQGILLGVEVTQVKRGAVMEFRGSELGQAF